MRMLVSAARNNAVQEAEDLFTFFRAHYDPTFMGLADYEKALNLLERAVFSMASAEARSSGEDLKEQVTELKNLRQRVVCMVEKEQKKVPFHGTPEQERQLLEDILELTDADKAVVYTKLSRLADLVRARQDTINVLGDEKGRATKLAWIGLAGTILLGIVSIILTIWTMRQPGT